MTVAEGVDRLAFDGPLLVILGPTATGKTALALHLAPVLDAEVVSADSAMVYRHLDIGTAKPTAAERARVPHHLVDVVDPDQQFSVAEFKALARAAIADIRARGRLPMVVGGTGLYIRALLQDYPFEQVAAPPDPELRRRLEEEARREGSAALHRRLARLDPESASRIHPNDLKRVIRALEVIHRTGQPPSRWRAGTAVDPGPCVLKLGLTCDRQLLYRRIERRTEQQIAAGFVEEVRRLLAMGYPPDAPGLQVLGYRHLVDHVLGRLPLAEAIARIQRDTRRLAKRQWTWFRRERGVRWVDVDERPAAELAALLAPRLEEFIQRCRIRPRAPG